MDLVISEICHTISTIITKNYAAKVKKRERERHRWKKQNYKRSEVKWNIRFKEDQEKYQRTLENAKKAKMPLAVYLKEA